MNNTVATPEAESTVRRTSLCKCGKKAEFIKDYWVTESKVLKEQSGDDVHSRSVEGICGIMRRRYCPSCLSRIAAAQRKNNRRLNGIIFAAAFIPCLIAVALYAVSVFVLKDTSHMVTLCIFGVLTVAVTVGLAVLFSKTQSKRKAIEKGNYGNIKAVDMLLDSLNFGLEDSKKLKDMPSVDVLVDGDGRVNYDMERSGYYFKVVYNGRIFMEPMRQRIMFPFKDDAEYVRRTYVNADLLEDNIRSIDAKALTADDFEIKNGTLARYSGLSVEVVIPENVTAIGEAAFKKSKNCEKIVIPETVTEIAKEAFVSCPATEISIPSGIKVIRSFTFYLSAVKSVIIPEGVEEIEDNAFGECYSLERVVIPSTCKKIGEAAFKGCSLLNDVTLNEGVESLADYCFNGCAQLKRIEIPDGCCELGNFCFEGCKELTDVYVPDTIQFVGGRVFDGATKMSIIGKEGSYAEKLAEELRVRFTPITESRFKKQHGAKRT